MSRNRWPITLAALAVLFAGLTNAHAHVHLCFDGREPPASIHGAHDGNVHHEHEQKGDHDDLDIDLDEQALAKAFKLELPAITAPAIHVFAATEPSTSVSIADPGDRPSTDPPFSRPYLRAPPKLAQRK
jgi:hypothetical protein